MVQATGRDRWPPRCAALTARVPRPHFGPTLLIMRRNQAKITLLDCTPLC